MEYSWTNSRKYIAPCWRKQENSPRADCSEQSDGIILFAHAFPVWVFWFCIVFENNTLHVFVEESKQIVPEQTASLGAHWSGTILFVQAFPVWVFWFCIVFESNTLFAEEHKQIVREQSDLELFCLQMLFPFEGFSSYTQRLYNTLL